MHPFRSIVVKLYFWIGNFQGNFLLSAIGRRLLAKWCRSNLPFKCMTRNVHLFLSLGFLLSFRKRFGWISILKWRTFRFSLFRVSHQFSGHKVELKSQSRNLRYLTSGFIFVKAHELLKNSDTGERKKAVEGKWERRLKKMRGGFHKGDKSTKKGLIQDLSLRLLRFWVCITIYTVRN